MERLLVNSSTRRAMVLVVEDEALVRMEAADYLRMAGFAVLEATNGEEALQLLDVHAEIDVLFTDIRLGGQINGWEVAEAFRSRHPDIPVLYTSGNSISPPRNVERSRFFSKPYRPEEIAAACHIFCETRP
jgi:CheY-like chemotaxis protein